MGHPHFTVKSKHTIFYYSLVENNLSRDKMGSQAMRQALAGLCAKAARDIIEAHFLPCRAGRILLVKMLKNCRRTYRDAQQNIPYREREMSSRSRNILRGVMIALAAVLVKAINICTECIGLG